MNKKEKNHEIIARLKKEFPSPKIALEFSNEWELLVSVILSAQCTDKRVNIVTKELFKKYKTVEDYAKADLLEFEQDIRPTGFYKNKAKNIIATANLILNEFEGKVPQTLAQLITLKGVARKTANVVLGHGFGLSEGIAVDTHVTRISNRFEWTKGENAVKIEKDLMKIIPRKDWIIITNLLIDLGRSICVARSPKCDQCFLNDICPSAFQFKKFAKTKS